MKAEPSAYFSAFLHAVDSLLGVGFCRRLHHNPGWLGGVQKRTVKFPQNMQRNEKCYGIVEKLWELAAFCS
jgi:hypothetical protein